MNPITQIQNFTNQLFLVLLAFHIPLVGFASWIAGWKLWYAYIPPLFIPALGLWCFYRIAKKRPISRYIMTGILAPIVGIILIHVSEGTPWQGLLHFYFFIILGWLSFYLERSIIVISATIIIAYYSIFTWALPASVFVDENDWTRNYLLIGMTVIQSIGELILIHHVKRSLTTQTSYVKISKKAAKVTKVTT